MSRANGGATTVVGEEGRNHVDNATVILVDAMGACRGSRYGAVSRCSASAAASRSFFEPYQCTSQAIATLCDTNISSIAAARYPTSLVSSERLNLRETKLVEGMMLLTPSL